METTNKRMKRTMKRKRVNQEELDPMLEQHLCWIESDTASGTRLVLRYHDLSGLSFIRANLAGADFSRSDLFGANFFEADLSRADLSYAILSRAYLLGAVLEKANLSGAYLMEANCYGADFSCANLSQVRISGIKLHRAIFSQTKF